MSSKRPHTDGGEGEGGRRRLGGVGAPTPEDGLTCSRCTTSIPSDAESVELAPCQCTVCLKCLVIAHTQRGSARLMCCKSIVTSQQFMGPGRVPQGEAMKMSTGDSEKKAAPIIFSALENLPEEALSHITSYLTETTRALFAVALTAPSASWEKGRWGNKTLSEASKVVMGSPYYGLNLSVEYERGGDTSPRHCKRYAGVKSRLDWMVLNFFDVEEHVRASLTDGDVGAILVCIDAVNKLRTLRLPYCINVRGNGLAPLRGSMVLERLDLSFVSIQNERPVDQKLAVSEESVIPILNSILSKAGHSFSRLHLPTFWFERPSYGLLSQFIREKLNYGGPLTDVRSHAIGCWECNRNFRFHLRGSSLHITRENNDDLQCCPECDTKYCKDDADGIHPQVQKCDFCHKTKCWACADFTSCDCCDKLMCMAEGCVGYIECDNGCDYTATCDECAETEPAPTKVCNRCNTPFCNGCGDMEYSAQLQGYVCADCRREQM